MKDLIIAVMAIAIVLVIVLFVVWILEKERHREELARKNMSFMESLNLTGLPIACFNNNGQALNMVLDTGSNACLINQEALKGLEFTVRGTHDGVMGINGGGDKNGMLIYLPLSYKSYSFNFECCVSDLSETFKTIKQEYGVTLHGVLGTDFFTKYKYILDFNEMIAYSIRKP